MGMAQRQERDRQTVAPAMAGWLEEVQRDPRTLGAFRRRIESLLRDAAVARRVAGRLARLQEEGCASLPEVEGGLPEAGLGRPERAGPVLSEAVEARTRQPVAALAVAGGQGASVFGRCDCPGRCCLMVPDLRPVPAMRPPATPAGLGAH